MTDDQTTEAAAQIGEPQPLNPNARGLEPPHPIADDAPMNQSLSAQRRMPLPEPPHP